MGLVYVAKAPAAALPCVNGPAGWDASWTFPGPPWAPGFPLDVSAYTADYSLSLTLAALAVGSVPAAFTATILFDGADDASLLCHAFVITATVNGVAVTVTNSTGQATNYSGTKYGMSQNITIPALNANDVVTVTCCIISTTPQICSSVTQIVAGTLARGYMFIPITFMQAEEYTVGTDSWALKTTTSTRARYSSCGGVDPYGYIVGGANNSGNGTQSCNRYSPPTDAYAAQTSFATSARCQGAGCAISSLVYYFCGGNKIIATAYYANNDEFTPAGNSWAAKTAATSERIACSATAVGAFGYLFGGYGPFAGPAFLANNDKFDRVGNSWSAKASIPSYARRETGAATVNSLAYIFAGEKTGSIAIKDISQYTPGSDSWASMVSLVQAVNQRYDPVFTIGLFAYVPDGTTNTKFDPALNTVTTMAFPVTSPSTTSSGCAITS